jgi:serine/threonine protein kinase
MLARHLVALKKGISSLEKYYQKLSTSTPTTQTRHQLFPYPTSYNSLDGTPHSFEYTNQISNDKLLFLAKLNETGEKICVKFVRDYSVDAHLFCAQHGFAPALRCYQRIPGDWKMVVMDAIDDYAELCDSHLHAPHRIFTKIEEKLNELHQHSFVHGDIRDTNIMISKDKERFMLIDFDWGGEIGKARYPMNVNRKDIWRPEGAEDGKLIIADHDMVMLKHMKEKRI